MTDEAELTDVRINHDDTTVDVQRDGNSSNGGSSDDAAAKQQQSSSSTSLLCGVGVNMSVFLFVVSIIVAASLPLAAYRRNDLIATDRLRLTRLAQAWCANMDQSSEEGRTAVSQLEGFVHGANLTHSPPYFDYNDWPVKYTRADTYNSVKNATWAAQLSVLWNESVAETLLRRYPTIRYARLEPLGFISHWFPDPTSLLIGASARTYDAANCTAIANEAQTVRGGTTISGVIDTSIIFTRTLYYRHNCSDQDLLAYRQSQGITTPVATSDCPVSRCWWGSSRVAMSLKAVTDSVNLLVDAKNNSVSVAITVAGSTVPYFPENRTADAALKRVVSVSRGYGTMCDFAGMTLYVSSPRLEGSFGTPGTYIDTTTVVWTIVAGALFGFMALIVINLAAIVWNWIRDPLRHAPRQTPIAIVAAEIALHGDLWEEAPVAAASVLASVAEMVHEQAKEHEAYVAGSTGHGYLIVADRPDKALNFMREFNAELSRAVFQSEGETSSSSTRRSRGAKQLVLAHARMVAHFGEDVSIAVNASNKAATYGGNDITVARTLLASAPPDADMYVTGALSEIVKMAAAVPTASSRSQECAKMIDTVAEFRVDTRVGSFILHQIRNDNDRLMRSSNASRSMVSETSSLTVGSGEVASSAANAGTAGLLGDKPNRSKTQRRNHDSNNDTPNHDGEEVDARSLVQRVCDEGTSTALKEALRVDLVAEPAAVQRNFAALVTCAEYFHEAIVMVLSPFRTSTEADAVTSRLRLTFGLPTGAPLQQFHVQLAARTTVLHMRLLLSKGLASQKHVGNQGSKPPHAPKRSRSGPSSSREQQQSSSAPAEPAPSNPLSSDMAFPS